MKSWCSIFVLFLLLLLPMEARKSPEEYWKKVMGDDPLPEALKDHLTDNQEGKDPVLRRVNGHGGDSSDQMGMHDWDRLINRNFDTRSVAIIYHHHNDDHHHLHQSP